ncbi:glycoside hydrolase family protein [Oleiphilus messinensis]|nr:hypothetical protein [Oleiphilus messinensis]
MSQTIHASRRYFSQTFTAETALLNRIRSKLAMPSPTTPIDIPDNLSFKFKPDISQVYVTLFQNGCPAIRWGARRNSLAASLDRTIQKLKSHRRFNEFSIADPAQCRIMFEVVLYETQCNIRNLTAMKFNNNRFEAGIVGLKYTFEGTTRYFMPTDAITHSIMTVPQLLNHLSKQTGHAKLTTSIKERTKIMREADIDFSRIISAAFVTMSTAPNNEDNAIPLFRGQPVPSTLTPEALKNATLKSIDWLVENMNDDGSFLYFYDGIKDTKVDLDHPNMVDPLYNNILRHSGGTITLLRGYELTKNPVYLTAASRSIEFFLTTFQRHEYRGRYACYPFFNQKSKLGGAGVGLVALMQHFIFSGSDQFNDAIYGLVNHLLSRIAQDGEMIGYYIHPNFNQGYPLEDIDQIPHEQRKQLFSFYYPGEALLGLALFYQHMPGIDTELREEVRVQSLKALDFLVDERPSRYPELFLPLPADAWLMQAIEEWVKVDGFKKQSYIDFVFNDTQQMFNHMYTEENAPWFDYVGGFFYEFGDNVYHDASRCEGVVAAYYLARYLGMEEKAQEIMAHMIKSANGVMFTRNTAESLYSHRHPEKSLNSFRFKLTRQWVRVDSVQHTACFFARLYPHFPNSAKA